MLVAHREHRLLVGPALDFGQEVGQFFVRGQCAALVIAPAGTAPAFLQVPAGVRGILAKFPRRKAREGIGPACATRAA
jgi:hypothetical protein